MKVVADLHLHSKYSRAVSPQMVPEVMARWAKKKGIDLLGTGDWTHPLWLKELESSLEEGHSGIYKLKTQKSKIKITDQNSKIIKENKEIKFILSTEISSIYSQGGKGRRIHNLVIAPSFSIVHKINEELKRRGCNLMSDGRPIIGLSSINLCELLWSIDKNIIVVPCHAWTPWFALYGSKSGFDSIGECYGQFADRIYAIETGLSSDPAMNWRIKELDRRQIVSFSDAHSPAKLGRELTVFEVEKLNFANIHDLLRSPAQKFFSSNRRRNNLDVSISSSASAVNVKKENFVQAPRKSDQFNNPPAGGTMKQWNNRILYTIEFYPEEGKYHYSGHRNCGIKQSPEETKKKGAQCPVCGKQLTLGVMHRVEELAGRGAIKPLKKSNESGVVGYYNLEDQKRPPYVMLVPLAEILAESLSSTVSSQKVLNEYENLTTNFGSELNVLTQSKLEEISRLSGSKVADGVLRVRSGQVQIEPGYDGVFGKVKIWGSGQETLNKTKIVTEQESLF